MLRFNTLLHNAGIDPAGVRLLRHQPVLGNGLALIDKFHSDRAGLLAWQSIQSRQRRSHLAAPFWASFLGTPDGKTVFEGLYRVAEARPVDVVMTEPLTDALLPAGTCDHHVLETVPDFEPYAGKLLIEWGGGASGKRAWVQRAGNQDKPINAILECPFEQPFPGYLAFRHAIGGLASLTPNWIEHLRNARGVYLLCCLASGRLYVGSATGAGGFWGRWQDYRVTGHGGNQGLMGRDTGLFMVSILQVAGSSDTQDDIVALEQTWKDKLLTRAFGFNYN